MNWGVAWFAGSEGAQFTSLFSQVEVESISLESMNNCRYDGCKSAKDGLSMTIKCRTALPLLRVGLFLTVLFCVHLYGAHAASGSLKFTNHMHDFGNVYRGAKVSYKFQFVNAGSGPVAITGVHAACGCTAAEIEKGKEYVPGESGFIEVSFNSADFQGRVVKSVTVMTSEKLLPDRVLTVKADVKSEIEVMPPIADFGPVVNPLATSSEIVISPIGKFELKISKVEFNVKLLTVTAVPNGKETKLLIKLNAEVPTGFFKETVLVHTNSTYLPIIEIPVRADIKGNVDFSPSYIEFGAIQPSETVKRSLTLKYGNPVKVVGTDIELIVNGQKVSDPNAFVKISSSGFEQNKQHIAVEISNAQGPSGAVHGRLLIKTNDLRQQQIDVDFYAFFR